MDDQELNQIPRVGNLDQAYVALFLLTLNNAETNFWKPKSQGLVGV